jgi:hypothetical protein
MRKLMLAGCLLALSTLLCAQPAKTTQPTTPNTHKAKASAHQRAHNRFRSNECHPNGTVCQIDVEDILEVQNNPDEAKRHKECDRKTAIWLNVDRGDSIMISKRDSKTSDFTLTIDPDDKDKEKVEKKGSRDAFPNPPPDKPVQKWWSGPAMGVPGACYHINLKTVSTATQASDPHIMYCGSGTLCY